jgi:hypothetical protein
MRWLTRWIDELDLSFEVSEEEVLQDLGVIRRPHNVHVLRQGAGAAGAGAAGAGAAALGSPNSTRNMRRSSSRKIA